MAYPNNHVILRAHGAFSNAAGVEKWSTGLRLGIPGADALYFGGALLTFVNAAHAAFTTFHSASNVASGTTCYFVNCSAAVVGRDGKYDPDGQETTWSTGSPIAGNGATVMPFSTASVISLRTARPRGYASNGRVYWPAIGAQVSTGTGRMTSTQTNARLNAFRTCLNAINTAAAAYDPGLRVMVMSAVGTGRAETVNQIRIDDRLDSIERRDNDSPAVWVTAPIP